MASSAHSTAADIGPGVLRADVGRRAPLLWLALAALALVIVTTPDGASAELVVTRIAGVALPVGVGLFELRRRPADRYARFLVAAGAAWSLTTLADSADSTLYSIGRVSVWVVEPLLVALLLSAPYGRIASVVERRVVWLTALIATTLYVPTALVAEFPVPGPWASCQTNCPSNAFRLVSDAGAVDGVIGPLREVLTVVVLTAVAAVLVRRTRRSSVLLRHMLTPIGVIAVTHVLVMSCYFLVRVLDPNSPLLDPLGWVYILSLPALALAFAGGLVRQRLFAADALGQLTRQLDGHVGVAKLRITLARALQDPLLDIVALPAPRTEPGPGRALTAVGAAGGGQLAIAHDAALLEDPDLLAGVVSYAGAELEVQQLNDELRTSLEDLSTSRARVVAVADDERRRIERDLHDGAQQHLVTLGIKLELLAEGVESEAPGTARRLRELEPEIDTTIEEVRRFASGLYPALLEDRGLEEAVRAAARRSPLATTVEARLSRRFPRQIERAVYFACVEALQNATKHATGAGRVTITMTENGSLRFEVRDDGGGFDMRATAPGAGLRNLEDRLAAVGGELRVVSDPGRGTRVRGAVPLPSLPPGQPPPPSWPSSPGGRGDARR